MKRLIICLAMMVLFAACATPSPEWIEEMYQHQLQREKEEKERMAPGSEYGECMRACKEGFDRCAAKGGFNLKRLRQMARSGECIRWLTLCEEGCRALTQEGYDSTIKRNQD